jgi:hypothetical protein
MAASWRLNSSYRGDTFGDVDVEFLRHFGRSEA